MTVVLVALGGWTGLTAWRADTTQSRHARRA
jgi:hypothetical protein